MFDLPRVDERGTTAKILVTFVAAMAPAKYCAGTRDGMWGGGVVGEYSWKRRRPAVEWARTRACGLSAWSARIADWIRVAIAGVRVGGRSDTASAT